MLPTDRLPDQATGDVAPKSTGNTSAARRHLTTGTASPCRALRYRRLATEPPLRPAPTASARQRRRHSIPIAAAIAPRFSPTRF
jgi:hypothetical protein